MRTLLHAPRPRKRSIAAATLGALALIGSLLVATPATALNDTGTGGVFVPASGRILDTKNNIGGYNTPMPAKAWRSVQVTGVAGLPDDGTVGAVSVVATTADIPGQGQLFGRPDADTSQTLMGIYGGTAKSNTSFSSVLAVGADGTIQVYAETSIRLILDVQGYYTANTDGTAAGGFVPSNGKRVADSRSGTGIPKAQLTTGNSATLQVTGTVGVPAGASAVIVNLIALNSTSSVGYLTPYATGATRPSNSFNYAGGVITTMQAQVPLSADGKITIYNANSTIDLAIDVQGYFTAAGNGGAVFTPGQGRIVDTRNTGGNLAGNETRAYDVAGKAGVPVMGSGVNAVVLTLTSIATNGGGWGRVWANGTTEPDTASLRYEDGTIRTNTITVPLGANGKVNLHNIGSGATNFVIDIQGWYADPAAPTVVCPQPYSSGSWSTTIPDDAIQCKITVGPAFFTGEQIRALVDDIEVNVTPLSALAATVVNVSVPSVGGTHEITAWRVDDNNESEHNPAETFTLSLGDWAAKSLEPSPQPSEVTGTTPTLDVASSRDVFGPDALRKYTLSANSDGVSDPIISSDWIPDPLPITEGTLSAETTYYWTVEVQGRSGGRSAVSIVASPVLSFTTSAAVDQANAEAEASVPSNDSPPIGTPAARSAAAASTPTRCGPVTMIVVRGSNEAAGSGTSASGHAYKSGGLGLLGNLVTQIRYDKRIPLYAESLKYPASITPNGSRPAYFQSRDAGVSALVGEINNLSSVCRYTNIWLAGYSQGANLIDKTLSSPISKQLTSKSKLALAGVTLFGDPTYWLKEKIDAVGGDYARNGGLLRTTRTAGQMNGYTRVSSFSGKAALLVKSYCLHNDIFCDGGTSVKVHESYADVSKGIMADASSFLKQFVISAD